jgi:PAS domain S-box-containing protein
VEPAAPGLERDGTGPLPLMTSDEPSLVAVATVTGERIVDANGAFLRLTGYTAMELAAGLIGWRALTPPEWAAEGRSAVTELRSRGSTQFRQECLRRDGRRVPVEVSAVRLSRAPLTWMAVVRAAPAEPADGQLWPLADLSAMPGQGLPVTELTRASAPPWRLQVLQTVTAGLARAVTTEEIAGVLVRDGMSLVAAHGVVAVLDRADDVLCTWTTGNFPAEVCRAYARIPVSQNSSTPVGQATMTGQEIILPSIGHISRRFPQTLPTHSATSTSSMLAVPLRAGGRSIGALGFGFPAEGEPGPEAMSAARILADLAGQALGRARMYEAEHAAAHRLQQALLPQVPNQLPGATVSLCYRPAEQGQDVGGDWYDVFELPGGRIGCAVGDVAGHDLAAAAAMGRLQLLLRYLATRGLGPAQVLRQLDLTCPAMTGTEFATVAYAEYDPARRTLTYACAGHLPPLLVTAGRASYLNGGRCGPLGMAGSPGQATLSVPPGSRLILYTDGLIERRERSIDQGLEQLAAVAAGACSADAETVGRDLLEAMAGDQPLTDDVAIACLTLTGP